MAEPEPRKPALRRPPHVNARLAVSSSCMCDVDIADSAPGDDDEEGTPSKSNPKTKKSKKSHTTAASASDDDDEEVVAKDEDGKVKDEDSDFLV